MGEAILLTYDVHADVDRDEYEQWLRDVDNPFFNSQPGIKEYVNWKVSRSTVGDIGFPYFDLIVLDDGAKFEDIFLNNPDIAEFAGNWVKRWGVKPDGDPVENYKGGMAHTVATPSG